MNNKHIRGSLTNTHVQKEDPRQRTADHSIVGVSPMARTTSIVDEIISLQSPSFPIWSR